MELKIAKQIQSGEKKVLQSNLFKIFYNGRGFWISKTDFDKFPGYLTVEDDKIILKDPIEQFYDFKIKKNKNGDFNVLFPKQPVKYYKGIESGEEKQENEFLKSEDIYNVAENESDLNELSFEKGLEERLEIGDKNYQEEDNSVYGFKRVKKTEDGDIERYSYFDLLNKESTKEKIEKFEVKSNLKTSIKKEYKSTLPEKKPEKIDKISFINNLLDYSLKKKIDEKTRERLFELIGKEVEKSGLNKEQIEAIIDERLEQKLRKDISLQSVSHDPKNTVSVLSLFDTEFKYLTHEWDNEEIEFNRETYLKNIIFPIYYSSINANKKLPSHLKSRLWAFIKKPKINEWEDNIWFVNPLFGKPFKSKYGWSSEAFIDWYDNSINKNIADTPMILDEMINPFKNSIQIRKGKLFDHLNPITNEILENKFEINYNKERLDSAKFYTDVQDFFIAVKIILKNIKEEAETNDRYSVEFNYTEIDNFKILEIIHIDSKCKLNGTLNILGGNSNSIKEKLTGLCNWSIEAVFADGPKRLNILWDKQIAEVEDINYQPKGFVHKLYFY